MLDAEADRLVNADRYARSEEREGYRASHYDRSFTTTSGEVNLRISTRALHIILLTYPVQNKYNISIDEEIRRRQNDEECKCNSSC